MQSYWGDKREPELIVFFFRYYIFWFVFEALQKSFKI